MTVKHFIEKGLKLFPDSELVYESENYYYINLESVEAAIYYCQNEKKGLEKQGKPQYVWCIAYPNKNENMFYHYKKTFLLIFVQDKYDLYGTEIILIDKQEPGNYSYVTYDNGTFKLHKEDNEEYYEAAIIIEDLLLDPIDVLEEQFTKKQFVKKIKKEENVMVTNDQPKSQWRFYLHQYGDDTDEIIEKIDVIPGTLQDAIEHCKEIMYQFVDDDQDLTIEIDASENFGACYATCYGDSRDNAYPTVEEFLEHNPGSYYQEFDYQVTFEKANAETNDLMLEAKNKKLAKIKWHGKNINSKFLQNKNLNKEALDLSNQEDIKFIMESLARYVNGEVTFFIPIENEVWAIRCFDKADALKCIEIAKDEKLGPVATATFRDEIIVYFPTLRKTIELDEIRHKRSIKESYEKFMARRKKDQLNESVFLFWATIIDGLIVGTGLFLLTLIIIIWNAINEHKKNMKLKSVKEFKNLSKEEQEEIINTVKENASDEVVTDAIYKLAKIKPNWFSKKIDSTLIFSIKKAFKKLMGAKATDIVNMDISKKNE
jgi:hypothetical protein